MSNKFPPNDDNKFPEDEFEDDDFKEDEFEKIDGNSKDEVFYTEDEYNDLLDENIELKRDQIFISQKELNAKILNDSIAVCSKSIFWYFKSYKSKIKEIKIVYMRFSEMIENDIDPISI